MKDVVRTLKRIQIRVESMIRRSSTVCCPGALDRTYLKIKAKQKVEAAERQTLRNPKIALIMIVMSVVSVVSVFLFLFSLCSFVWLVVMATKYKYLLFILIYSAS